MEQEVNVLDLLKVGNKNGEHNGVLAELLQVRLALVREALPPDAAHPALDELVQDGRALYNLVGLNRDELLDDKRDVVAEVALSV